MSFYSNRPFTKINDFSMKLNFKPFLKKPE